MQVSKPLDHWNNARVMGLRVASFLGGVASAFWASVWFAADNTGGLFIYAVAIGIYLAIGLSARWLVSPHVKRSYLTSAFVISFFLMLVTGLSVTTGAVFLGIPTLILLLAAIWP
jgi:hypothetical protein